MLCRFRQGQILVLADFVDSLAEDLHLIAVLLHLSLGQLIFGLVESGKCILELVAGLFSIGNGGLRREAIHSDHGGINISLGSADGFDARGHLHLVIGSLLFS